MEEDQVVSEQTTNIVSEVPEKDVPVQSNPSSATSSIEAEVTVSSLKKELRMVKAQYEKETAILQQKINTMNKEREELIQEKTNAIEQYNRVLNVSLFDNIIAIW